MRKGSIEAVLIFIIFLVIVVLILLASYEMVQGMK